jgi:hypothetical protein
MHLQTRYTSSFYTQRKSIHKIAKIARQYRIWQSSHLSSVSAGFLFQRPSLSQPPSQLLKLILDGNASIPSSLVRCFPALRAYL